MLDEFEVKDRLLFLDSEDHVLEMKGLVVSRSNLVKVVVLQYYLLVSVPNPNPSDSSVLEVVHNRET